MKPDAIFKCLKSYKGKNQEGKPVRFEEGKEYMRTTVDMKQMGCLINNNQSFHNS